MKYLSKNLESKHKLKFNEYGKFKILQLSDIQETLNYNEKTLENIEKIIDVTKPDLVILAGDNCDGLKLNTKEELERYLTIFTFPMEKRKIPWAHVFGNHDHDLPVDDLEKQLVYEKFKYCISKHTENDIYGTTNFVLPIWSHDLKNITFNVWGIDTNNLLSDNENKEISKISDLENRPDVSGSWDFIHFTQLMWYWNSSEELEKYNNSKIDGLMVMHIPLWEFELVLKNKKSTNLKGAKWERMNLATINSGMFATILQRGDICAISCGHSHMNSFEGKVGGIKLCYDACAGCSCYGMEPLRGGRIFELNENNPKDIKTYMVYYNNIN